MALVTMQHAAITAKKFANLQIKIIVFLALLCAWIPKPVPFGIWSAKAMAQPDPFEVPLNNLKRKAPENVVRFEISAVTNGNSELRLVTRDDFKIYAKGLEVYLYQKGGTKLLPLSFGVSPLATKIMDPFYNEEREVHFSGAKILVTLPNSVILGTDSLLVRFEACSNTMCLLPTKFEIPLVQGAKSKIWKNQNTASDISQLLEGNSANVVGESRLTTKGLETLEDKNLIVDSGNLNNSNTTPSEQAITNETPKAESQQDNRSLQDPAAPPLGITKKSSYWVQSALTERSWLLFPALFLAGLLMNLTPCVYPMIPITLNVISQFGGAASDSAKKRKRRTLPFLYVGGMVISYTLMGVVAGMTGTIFGSLLQSTYVTIGLALLMFLLGLSMLGVFSMDKLQHWAARIPVAEKYPTVGVTTMGAVSGLISAPCTGPVLSTILLLIGQTKDPIYGFTLMFFFSLGFGTPYIGLGLFTQKLQALPKVGSLLIGTKYLFSSLMFALSLYYLKPVISQWEIFRPLYAEPHPLIVSLFSFLLFVIFVTERTQPQLSKFSRFSASVFLTAFALWLTLWLTSSFVSLSPIPYFANSNTLSPNPNYANSTTSSEDTINSTNRAKDVGVKWMKNWDQAVIRATVENKPMLVDLWAEWCAACLKMDATIWVDKDLGDLINQKFVALKLDFTTSNPFSEALTEKWQITGLPAVALFPAGAPKEQEPPILFREAVGKEELLLAIEKTLK